MYCIITLKSPPLMWFFAYLLLIICPMYSYVLYYNIEKSSFNAVSHISCYCFIANKLELTEKKIVKITGIPLPASIGHVHK